jgi:hypothetical protein
MAITWIHDEAVIEGPLTEADIEELAEVGRAMWRAACAEQAAYQQRQQDRQLRFQAKSWAWFCAI